MGTYPLLLPHPWEAEARLEGSSVWRSVVTPPRKAHAGPHPSPGCHMGKEGRTVRCPRVPHPRALLLTVPPFGSVPCELPRLLHETTASFPRSEFCCHPAKRQLTRFVVARKIVHFRAVSSSWEEKPVFFPLNSVHR